MNADIIINESGPGLVPFGCFEILLPAILAGLERTVNSNAPGTINEWRGELYLDEIEKEDFNIIIQNICTYVSSRQDSRVGSQVFSNFWNVTLLPIIRADPRYECDCQFLSL